MFLFSRGGTAFPRLFIWGYTDEERLRTPDIGDETMSIFDNCHSQNPR